MNYGRIQSSPTVSNRALPINRLRWREDWRTGFSREMNTITAADINRLENTRFTVLTEMGTET